MTNQPKWKSKTAWVSVLSLILFVAKTYFNYELPEADKLIELILLVATSFGIWNNPERSDKF